MAKTDDDTAVRAHAIVFLYRFVHMGPPSEASKAGPGWTSESDMAKAIEALNRMPKDEALAAFKACCGSTKYAQAIFVIIADLERF